MSNMLSRLLAIGLAFILCVFAPFSLAVMSDNITARFAVMSDVENFMDEVADSRRLSEDMLSNFYLDVSSHGLIMDIEVSRYVRVVETDMSGSGKLVTTYMLTSCDPTETDDVIFNSGDKIVVHVKPVGYTVPQRIVMSTVGQVLPDFDYTFPKRVR